VSVLARGASVFGGAGFGGAADCGGGLSLAPVAVDDVGGTFAAAGGPDCNTILVGFRRAGGQFAQEQIALHGGYQQLGLGAGGNGYAALGEVYGGFRPGYVAIELVRKARLGPRRVLARTPYVANAWVYGPAVDRTGQVTVAWLECGAQRRHCSVSAERANANGKYGPALKIPNMGVAAIAPGTLALSQCHGNSCAISFCLHARCSISVALANKHNGFSRPQQITANGQLDQLATDRSGDQLLVWTASDGSIWAATRAPTSGRFSPPHELAPPGNQGENITAAFGSRGEAIVAWGSVSGGSMAEVYHVSP
jgi:hypothetical protein